MKGSLRTLHTPERQLISVVTIHLQVLQCLEKGVNAGIQTGNGSDIECK